MSKIPFFQFAAVYLAATIVFYVSTGLAAGDVLDPTGREIAFLAAIGSFGVVLGSMWLLYRAIPLPGMLCVVLAVTVLGVAAALDMGLLRSWLDQKATTELTANVFIGGVVLLCAAVMLMPSRVVTYLRTVIIPALLGRRRDR